MLGINVQPDWQKARVGLMRRFGYVLIGGRECIGCINPANNKEVVYLSHAMLDTWAQDGAMHKHCATEFLPPTGRTEFQWIPIHPKPGQRLEYTADTVQSTSQIPDNWPEFEDYLKWAKILLNDQAPQDLLTKCDIVDLKAFLSPSLDVPTLERLEFAFGTAVCLHDSAPSYQTDLKEFKAMQMAYLDKIKDK
ncbi:uncharacterized protein MELLADRAFT_84564 [Melampsora larici-populina 98AG31]|uniref:Uncharacterized protein n=1 Tax=Melampsora larici-populina (strain 98AG31 / pathotype 3-4-7) TaxID=747676 RepID=F4SCH0_MELLP|nr:uncharacterized protein MELLADRAFT_84564 [Melampsora larici-populina 98AG31]EGF97660.1 hypothetical protein MELLADRAFT_84564 [Melampsora larici-populina 98AG31]